MPTYFAVLLLAALPAVLGQSCSSTAQQYNSASVYGGPGQCIPTGYFQAQDVGQTNQQDLITRCRAQCVAFGSRCTGYAGQLWKAADSNLMTGQCYFYTALPASPASCVNSPSIILAEAKDNTGACLSSSLAVATTYCSSYLNIGVVTSYTSTRTPTFVVTKTVTSTTTTTSKTEASQQVTRTTIISTQTIIPPTVSSTLLTGSGTTTSLTSTTTIQGTSLTPDPVPGRLKARATSASPPSCLASTSVPASRVSSACSCLSIASSTLRTTKVAPTTTVTSTVTVPATATTTSTSTKTTTLSTYTSTTAATPKTTFTVVTTTSTVTSVVATNTACADAITNPGFETWGSPVGPGWNTTYGSLDTWPGMTIGNVNFPCYGNQGRCMTYQHANWDARHTFGNITFSLSQTMNVCPQTTYQLSFYYYYRVAPNDPLDPCQIQACVNSACSTVSVIREASYHLVTLDPVLLDNSGTATITVGTTDLVTCSAFALGFDQFSFKPYTQ